MKYKIVLVSNFFNHHQVEISDSFYKKLNGSFLFIETEDMPDSFKNSGYPVLYRNYVMGNSSFNKENVINIINNADVVIFGSAPEFLFEKRILDNKLTFRYSERVFKKNYFTLLSPFFWKYLYTHHFRYKNKNLYMLCASSFTKSDFNLVGLYKNKCFKWGYFPELHKNDTNFEKSNSDKVSLIWVGRFIDWKHPEMAINVIKRLVENGYKNLKLNMYGRGPLLEDMIELVKTLNLDSYVTINGAVDNKIVNKKLMESDIFIFTSDRNEGWGAVLNEAMYNFCAVVVSDKIGSAKYLIKNKVNGSLFKSNSDKSLFYELLNILENKNLIYQYKIKARQTIIDVWNADVATNNFIELVKSFEERKEVSLNGPGSNA